MKRKRGREGKLSNVVAWRACVVSVVVVLCRVSPSGVGLRTRMKNQQASIGQNARKKTSVNLESTGRDSGEVDAGRESSN